jgi:hypothetical protein
MQGKSKNILIYTDKINSLKGKLILWGAESKIRKKVEMFEVTKDADLTKILSI